MAANHRYMNPKPSKQRSARQIRIDKQDKVIAIQKLIHGWTHIDPVKEWHHALADLVESYDYVQLLPDEIRRREFDNALTNARRLLKDD